jgi:hypothetical protein
MSARFSSMDRFCFFFQPVPLHFQLADLLLETANEGFLTFGLIASSRREELGQSIQGLLFPLGNLCWVNGVLSGYLIGRFVSLDGFQCHPRLQVAAVGVSLFWHFLLLRLSLSLQLF